MQDRIAQPLNIEVGSDHRPIIFEVNTREKIHYCKEAAQYLTFDTTKQAIDNLQNRLIHLTNIDLLLSSWKKNENILYKAYNTRTMLSTEDKNDLLKSQLSIDDVISISLPNNRNFQIPYTELIALMKIHEQDNSFSQDTNRQATAIIKSFDPLKKIVNKKQTTRKSWWNSDIGKIYEQIKNLTLGGI